MAHAIWVLIWATHVYYGAVVNTQEFTDRLSCENAAKAVRSVAGDAYSHGEVHTWCVPKSIAVQGD